MTGTASFKYTINIVELNNFHPRPFVFTDIAKSWRDVLRLNGVHSEHLVNESKENEYSIILGTPISIEKFLHGKNISKFAIANFEQLGSTSPLLTLKYIDWLKDKIVIDYHSNNINYLINANGSAQKAVEFPLVTSSSMANTPDVSDEKLNDILFFGTMSPRRKFLIEQLRALNLRVECVSGAYGSELAPALARSRLVVHAHFYDTALFPIARLLRPIAIGMPIVCEDSVFSKNADWSQSGISFVKFENIASRCQTMINDSAEQLKSIQKTLRFNSTFEFRDPIQEVFSHFDSYPSRIA